MSTPNRSPRSDRVALVTGASAGIGVAVAEEFVARGYAVGIVGRSADRLAEVRRRLEESGGCVLALAGDLADLAFAESVVPGAIAQFSGNQALANVADYLAPGTWLYFVLSAVLIVFFTYFYTAIIFNPADVAENLKKQGGFIPGIKPGAKTADHIQDIVTRITLPGAIFLTFIALLPIWLADLFAVPFQFGGTSLLIVVGVALDTMAQVQQHLLLRKYDGFMKKGRVRFRGRNAGVGGF